MYPDGGSKNLDIILSAAVDPDVVIDPNDRSVDDVIEACLVAKALFISGWVSVCTSV